MREFKQVRPYLPKDLESTLSLRQGPRPELIKNLSFVFSARQSWGIRLNEHACTFLILPYAPPSFSIQAAANGIAKSLDFMQHTKTLRRDSRGSSQDCLYSH